MPLHCLVLGKCHVRSSNASDSDRRPHSPACHCFCCERRWRQQHRHQSRRLPVWTATPRGNCSLVVKAGAPAQMRSEQSVGLQTLATKFLVCDDAESPAGRDAVDSMNDTENDVPA
jgi:hypothetical protein